MNIKRLVITIAVAVGLITAGAINTSAHDRARQVASDNLRTAR